MNQILKEKLNAYTSRVEKGIEALLPPSNTKPIRLHSAMRYSIEAGGKRIRPALLFAASELFDSESDPTACAVAIECLHTYSLIHDDLPAMDNSELRRGKKSCHIRFDEATAILAGDALLTHAFQILAQEYYSKPELAVVLIEELAHASGSKKLIAGQQEDIDKQGGVIDAKSLSYIHKNKTAALLIAALRMGLYFCQPSLNQTKLITEAGYNLGMAFQIKDDVLDATSRSEIIGKPVGNDATLSKFTSLAFYGLDGANEQVKLHSAAARKAIEQIGGNNKILLEFVREMENRIS